MGFFDKFIPKKEDSTDIDAVVRQVRGAFDLSRQASIKLHRSETKFLSTEVLSSNVSRLIKQGNFEILLLNTTVVFQTAPLYLPDTYLHFKRGYLSCLEHDGKQLTDLGYNLSEILANRITFYTGILKDLNDEFNEYYDDVIYTDLASKFFEDPLALNHKRSTNSALAQRVTRNTRLMVKDLRDDLSYLFESKS